MTNVHEKSHNTGKDNLILLQISKKPQLKYNTKNKKNIITLITPIKKRRYKKGATFICKFYSDSHGSIAGTQKFHENCESCYFLTI